jgi:hypothetical protein
MNKYLEKIAKTLTENDDSGKINHKLEAGLGATAIISAPKRLLGYHTIYHGTSAENAKSIRENGFDPNRGGSGAAKLHGSERYIRESSNKIHVTKKLSNAVMFAGYNSMKSGKAPGIVAARVSDKTWQNMKADPDMGNLKYGAATTKHKIDSKYIVGGKDGVGISGMLNKRRLGNYYRSAEGKSRALRGVALATAGAGLIMHAANSSKKS